MEGDVLDILDLVGYDGPLSCDSSLLEACGRGFASPEYLELILWLASRLSPLTHTQSVITDEPDRCMLGVGVLLRQLCCPYERLCSALSSASVTDTHLLLQLLLFLGSELQAAQIVACNAEAKADVARLDETLQDLRAICDTLKLPEPHTQDVRETFRDAQHQLGVLLQQFPRATEGRAALQTPLDPAQWARLEKVNAALTAEYECRRRLLVKRLDVTVQSFGWSDRAKGKMDVISAVYQPRRFGLACHSVSMAHLLAARDDVCNLVKTSSGRQKTACAVNKVLMGRVPDRGGRPSEIQAPLPEMPSWRKRSEGRGGAWSGGQGGRGGWRHGRAAQHWH